ncbi:MAG: sigma-70 family RNA polymerase sigma factor [Candidatus Melainabacteria bacterium]|nr:sigma-70 family RNA polymerase sigma factor [Candidatus Melainabacteria bacterium]
MIAIKSATEATARFRHVSSRVARDFSKAVGHNGTVLRKTQVEPEQDTLINCNLKAVQDLLVSDELIDQNKIREQIKLESDEEKESRLLKAEIAKSLVGEIRNDIKQISQLCEEHKGKHPKRLVLQAEDLIKQAKEIDTKLKTQLIGQSADLLYIASLPMQKSLIIKEPLTLIASAEKFQDFIKHVAKKRGISELVEDDEVLALTAYYATRSKINPQGIIQHLPDKLISLGDKSYECRVRVLAKHFFIDLKNQKSARDIELFLKTHKYMSEFKSSGLDLLSRLLSFRELVKVAFPNHITGDNPMIREWLLPKESQEEDFEELCNRGLAWVLQFGEGVFDEKTRAFNLEKMRSVNWRNIFRKHGLRLDCMPHISNTLEAIKAGAKKLGRDDLLGLEREDQLHPWDVRRSCMWEEKSESKEKLINCITKFLVEVYFRKKYPFMFKDNGKGKLIPRELLKVSNWGDEFNSVDSECLQSSGIGPVGALQTAYPECFGWEESKIKPSEIFYPGIWYGKEGEKLFAQTFAYCLSKMGLGKFNSGGEPPLIFTKVELFKWKNEHLKTWKELFLSFNALCKNMNSVFKDICGQNIITAFKMLLGPLNEQTRCFGGSDILPSDVKASRRRNLRSDKSVNLIECRVESNNSEEVIQDEKQIPPVDISSQNSETHPAEGDRSPSIEELNKIENELPDEVHYKDKELIDADSGIDADDLIGLYLKEMWKIPRIKREKEIELAKRIEPLRKLNEVTKKLSEELISQGINREPYDNELSTAMDISVEEIKKIKNGDPDIIDAKDELVRANLRLVVSIAKRYRGRGLSFLDLIQEGNLGLMRAAEKYNYKLGFKFGTYATWWIRQAITRALTNKSRTIRVPAHIVENISELNNAAKKLNSQLNREPTEYELAAAMGTSAEKVKGIIAANKTTSISFGDIGGKEEDKEPGDFIEDTKALQPEILATNNFLGTDIEEVLKSLSQKEREVIRLRFGLDGEGPKTLDEVGKLLKITRERVRQIEQKAMIKLRKPHRRVKLQGYLDD